MPARKKDPSVRARRNKVPTRATLRRVGDDASAAETFASMTVRDLRAAIDVANADRPADQQIPKRGTKADLVELLVAAARNIPHLPSHPPRFTEDGERIPVDWHDQTVAWWNDVWTSPMANEWDASDIHNVFVIALLYDDIWSAGTARERKDALAEYRLQRADLGLSPYSRRRLEWTIETAAEATDRGRERRERKSNGAASQTRAAAQTVDPRSVLYSVQ